jgi:hypothetical protein
VIIAYKNNQPKNIFEEIYNAEMHAAWWKENTPLSNTEYFNGAVGTVEATDFGGTRHKSLTVKESEQKSSPYMLEVQHQTHKNNPWGSELKQKKVNIKSRFVYRNVDLKIYYQYVFAIEGSPEAFSDFAKEEGLAIYITGFVKGDILRGYKDFSYPQLLGG